MCLPEGNGSDLRPRPRDLHLEPRDVDRDAGRLDLRPLHAGDAGSHRLSGRRRSRGSRGSWCPGAPVVPREPSEVFQEEK